MSTSIPSDAQAWSSWVSGQLFEQRTVLLSGELDDQTATDTAAQLMTLDALGDEHITVQVNSWGGSLEAAFAVIDTIDLLGVPVHTLCAGRAEGPVIGVVAAGAVRRSAPHARFRLCQPQFESRGTAGELAEWSLHCRRQLDRFCERLALATGRSVSGVTDDLEAGRYLSAEEARRYGLVDEVGRGSPPAKPARSSGPPLGFHLPRH